jgi:hypothetical protein
VPSGFVVTVVLSVVQLAPVHVVVLDFLVDVTPDADDAADSLTVAVFVASHGTYTVFPLTVPAHFPGGGADPGVVTLDPVNGSAVHVPVSARKGP